MLVLSRKMGERIRVGNGIAITVVEVRGGKVRLGFEAPPAVPIHREEVYRRIQHELTLRGGIPCGESPFFVECA